MSANTAPEQYDPEATSSFKVGTLSERFTEAMTEQTILPQAPPLPTSPAGPSLVYVHSINGTQTLIDRHAPGATIENAEDRIRELMIARALLRHALHLVDKELNGL